MKKLIFIIIQSFITYSTPYTLDTLTNFCCISITFWMTVYVGSVSHSCEISIIHCRRYCNLNFIIYQDTSSEGLLNEICLILTIQTCCGCCNLQMWIQSKYCSSNLTKIDLAVLKYNTLVLMTVAIVPTCIYRNDEWMNESAVMIICFTLRVHNGTLKDTSDVVRYHC